MNLKKIAEDIDNRFLYGSIRRFYKKARIMKNRTPKFFNHHKSVVLREPVYDLILMQIDQRENEFVRYLSYDLAVRYLALENYYNRNDYGFRLYKKMHIQAGNYGEVNAVEDYYKKMSKRNKTPLIGCGKAEQHSIEQYKKLIQSVEANGFDDTAAVMSDKNLMLMNGSHRVVLALYNKMEFIRVQVRRELFQRRYSLDWFWQHGFEEDEIAVIKQTMENIISECRQKIGSYFCILFPPAQKYFDDIVSDIGAIDPNNISVVGYRDYIWEIMDFKNFLKGVYHFDSITQEAFERKFFYIMSGSEVIGHKCCVRIVELKINNPMYRLKNVNGMPESVATVRLKEAVRQRYRTKEKKYTEHYVGDYAHDIIIHSSDNYISNKAFRSLLGIRKDLSILFDRLKAFDYAVAMPHSEKISEAFPQNFFINEDIDILAGKEDLDNLVQITYNTCLELFDSNVFRIDVAEAAYGKRVYVLYSSFMVLMFDFMAEWPGLKTSFVTSSLKKHIGSDYYHTALKDELVYHLAAYMKNNTKQWHREFVSRNIHKISCGDVVQAFKNSESADRMITQILR